MNPGSTFVIESRIQLFSALAEAAEIEHNLMCLYLYAMFSLKRSPEEGLSDEEMEAVHSWRKIILSVSLEEMTHLTLVSNVMSALGGGPNFMRPNFPSSPGYYPADILVELAPFDMSTIEHFLYLERPRTEEMADGASFDHSRQYTRLAEKNRLMPSSGDYETVGSLYLSIKNAIIELSEKLGEKQLFCGSLEQQIGPLDASLPGLMIVRNQADALAAIDTIIAQGEGATSLQDSHFQRFATIRDQYQRLLAQNPDFRPGRPVARNPVMRKPLTQENRVWVTEPLAAQYMDLANALYALMLRLLFQIYTIEQRPKASKAILLDGSFTLMHAMATVAETLTLLPATSDKPDIHAGMSFAMVRFLSPLKAVAEKTLLTERYDEFLVAFARLKSDLEKRKKDHPRLQACLDQLKATADVVRKARDQAKDLPDFIFQSPLPKAPEPIAAPPPTPAPVEAAGVEVSETDAIRLTFDGKRCIHARHCVTELPNVFKANTPGTWIFAGNTHPEILSAVARECPSGAIQYQRKDGGPAEPTPDVNMIRIRENGPYAFLGQLFVDDQPIGMRATLCRCGQSQNKPFCDGAHNAAEFMATGNPPTIEDKALEQRNGPVKIQRLKNGPLAVSGNVEICAGTGRIVLRTDQVRLCRCGHSEKKPLCDGSHTRANFQAEGR